MPFSDCTINARSDSFLMVSFHLSRRLLVAILRHNSKNSWRARATTVALAAVLHAISASLLGKNRLI